MRTCLRFRLAVGSRLSLATLLPVVLLACGESSPRPADANRPDAASTSEAGLDAHGARDAPDLDGEGSTQPDAPADASGSDADGGVEPPSDAGGEGGAPGGDPRFTALVVDRSRIERVEMREQTDRRTGRTFRLEFFRNMAYRCGVSGYFTFVVSSPADVTTALPLWVHFHGGGYGYYRPDGTYSDGPVREVERNSEESFDALAPTQFDPSARHMFVSMCDHDLYGGLGQPYPYNPHWGGTDTVDGALASMAAIHFVARGNGRHPGYPTSLVFLSGSSAGGVGAYHVGAALARRGIRVNGISAAAYMITSRHPTLLAECAGAGGELGGLDGAAREKLGIWATDPSLLAENSFGSEYVVPFFFSTGESDPFCCGMRAALPSAAAAGYTNNCRWVYGALQAAVASAPPGSPPLGVCIGSGGHGGGGSECVRARQDWLDAVMAAGPVPPVFPE